MDDGLRRNTIILPDHTWLLLTLTVPLTMAPAQIHTSYWMFTVSSMVYLMSPKGLKLAITEKWWLDHHPQLMFCLDGAVTHTKQASCCCTLQRSPILAHNKETGCPLHLYFSLLQWWSQPSNRLRGWFWVIWDKFLPNHKLVFLYWIYFWNLAF